jgi:hypothetical protein
MQKTLSFLIFIFSISLAYSQDTIVKYNGSTIQGKVLEISVSEVKYKKLNFADGPTYIEKKSEIEMIKYANGMKEHFEKPLKPSGSQYTNGGNNQGSNDYYGGYSPPKNKIETWGTKYRYNDNTISEKELFTMLMQSRDKKIIELTQKAKDNKKYQYIGFGGIPFGIAAGYCLLASTTPTRNANGTYTYPNQTKYLSLAAAFAVIGIACPITSGVCKHNRTLRTHEAIKLYNEKY